MTAPNANAITWFEIPCAQLSRAAAFYERMTGLSLKRESYMDVPHAMFTVPGVGGALVEDKDNAPSPKGQRVFLNAAGALDAWLSRVETAGGKVVLPRTDIGPPGFIAIIQDTEGNHVGLHQPRVG
ncbi:VOC family protein [Pyxidicoccus fallax]|uniref:VOC family protein n=1 Tax=Pyxidicoccus fallax TaxID=394095 RepID=A0A848LJB2_9BACT|nr:VOC family protein [Pyxidicoccus fallax]NMO17821.1 VOC family protein [Pyxidicoccus fallax]NPC79861.1 VOC family protein [Pyxidicoccus fallax]